MERKFGKYNYLSKNEICEFLSEVDFERCNLDIYLETPFFIEFSKLYNEAPNFWKYKCLNKNKFNQSIDWMGIEEKIDNNKIKHYSYSINPIIYSLFKNNNIVEISTNLMVSVDYFLKTYKTPEDFEVIEFEEINPFAFDGILTQIVKEGGIFHDWSYSNRETKQMCIEFTDLFMENRYEDFRIFKTIFDWNGCSLGFFVAFLIFDQLNGELIFLAKDDYD